MADDAGDVDTERREPYIGEKQKLLRDGYGTYVYENHYFRYEGEWMKGKKQGHGKLVMKDGTYYEGQFINGEINGHGYKFFAFSQSKYTGQFLNGEMNGHGIIIYKDGSVYDGQWYRNRRQGFGVLSTRRRYYDEDIFQSSVLDYDEVHPYDNTYHNLSNGDRFEGNWVMDKRQGHGELFCADGTSYKGQFMNDLFHGEGTMVHISGVYYSGMWVNGFPSDMATKIVILVEETSLVLTQGQSFTIRVECSNDNDEFVSETGRELQVIVGFKYWKPKDGSALFDIIEDVEERPIETPFYDVVPYPLTDQLHDIGMVADRYSQTDDVLTGPENNQQDEGDDKEAEESVKDVFVQVIASYENNEISAQNIDSIHSVKEDEGGMSRETFASEIPNSISETTQNPTVEEVTHMLPPVLSKQTAHGRCEWLNLQLAPPPPMYRPFVIMEEETKIKMKHKESVVVRDYSNEEFEDEENEDDEEEEEMNENVDKEIKEAKEEVQSVEVVDNAVDNDVDNAVDGEVEGSLGGRKSSIKTSSLPPSVHDSKSWQSKMAEERFARPGEYILIVQEITNPLFMGRRLQPAYLVIQLTKPETEVVIKTSSEKFEDENEDEIMNENQDDDRLTNISMPR